MRKGETCLINGYFPISNAKSKQTLDRNWLNTNTGRGDSLNQRM